MSYPRPNISFAPTRDETVFGRVETPHGLALLRDLRVDDIELIATYLRNDQGMGQIIDQSRLPDAGAIRSNLMVRLRSGDPGQRRVSFAIELGGRLVGYSALNRYSLLKNYAHIHIIDPSVRQHGLASALFPHRMKAYFDLFDMSRVTIQTLVENRGANRLLEKYARVAATEFLKQPDGLALPGHYNIRHVYRQDLPRFFEMSTTLAGQQACERIER